MHVAKSGHDFDNLVIVVVSHLSVTQCGNSSVSSEIFANYESFFTPAVSFASNHASNAFHR